MERQSFIVSEVKGSAIAELRGDTAEKQASAYRSAEACGAASEAWAEAGVFSFDDEDAVAEGDEVSILDDEEDAE